MIISIGFSVALIYSLQFFVDEIKHSNDYTSLNPLKKYSEVSRKSDQPITKEIIQSIIENENTERIIPRIRQWTYYQPITGRNNVSVFSLNNTDMTYLINRLKIQLIQGHLPKEGTNEAVIDYRLAKNKNIKIGDKIGYDVNEKELFIQGSLKIVGLIGGDSMLALTARQDNLTDNEMYQEGMIVFHKVDNLQKSNIFLESLPKQNVKVFTYQIAYDAQEKDTKDLKRYINILVIMLIVVLSISAGNASYINTFQRRYEYGLLYSVGYSSTQILKQASSELFFINIMGYLAGILITLLFAGIEYLFLFEPNGLVLRLILPEAILQTLAIPIFTSLFSIIPVSRMLRKIDPIRIIEGKE
jgi:putative ABC transport system permease protein